MTIPTTGTDLGLEGHKYTWYESTNNYGLMNGLNVKASFWNDANQKRNHQLVLEQFYTASNKQMNLPNVIYRLIWNGLTTAGDTTTSQFFVLADGQKDQRSQKCTITAFHGQTDFRLESYVRF